MLRRFNTPDHFLSMLVRLHENAVIKVQFGEEDMQRGNTQQRSDSAHTYTQPTQLTLLEHRLQPTPPLTGQDGPDTHCSMYSGE